MEKCHNIIGRFVTNLKKCHKNMSLLSNILIRDENIVKNVIDQQVSCSVTNVVPRVLGLTVAMVRNLQLPILVCRRNYTTTEKVISTQVA
jgi:hypothetical protein